MISRIDQGALFMLLSALAAAFNGALTKVLTDDLSALEIVFFRSIVGMLFLLVMLKHTPTKLAGGKPFMLFLRGVLGFSAMILFFYTIATIPLGMAITLNETSPLFVSILAFFLLKERLSKRAILALFIGFGGVLLITKPIGLTLGYEYFLGVLGGFLAAAAYTTIKKIKHIYDARTIVLSFAITGAVLPLLLFFIAPYITPPESIAFLFTEFVMPSSPQTWILILLIGIIATLSQWLLTKAYSLSQAGIIGIVSYTNIPFAIGFGYMLGDAFPDFWAFCGIGLIVLGGLLVKKG
ncbi:MAG: DMT family transporter [Sulfurimonas sp.]|jgi:drug/metabolite transporter (DMT)-like permease|nr:DMT family transporter [Sulfurimonas sp.]